MAITINQNPKTYSPAYNEINFLVTSTNVAQDNFLYVCDVYITGVTPTYFRLKAAQDPTSNKAVFDIHRIIENYLTTNIDKSTYGFQRNTSSWVEYTCKFGEEYGLSSSGTTVYADLTVASAKYAFNGLWDFLEFTLYNDANYLLTSSSSLFLTSLKSKRVRTTMHSWAHFMANAANKTNVMKIVATSTTGGLTTTVVDNAFPSPATVTNDRFMRVSTGPANLNLIPSGSISFGAQPIIPTDTASYTITIQTGALGTVTSETLTYTIDDACTKNDVLVFHWLNKYGGFDSFSFIRANTQKADITRASYKKPTGTISGSTYSYSAADNQNTVFDTRIKDKIEVLSDWLTDAESVWLEELVTSPEIYLDDATYGLVAVNVIDKAYEKKKAVSYKAFNLKLTFEYSFIRNRQRG